MKISTSYYGNYRNFGTDNVVTIAISRTSPCYTDYEFSKLAPTVDMSNKFKNDLAVAREEYRNFISENNYAEELSQTLKDMFAAYDTNKELEANVILLCYEKDSTKCHRAVLAEELSKAIGFEVKEL